MTREKKTGRLFWAIERIGEEDNIGMTTETIYRSYAKAEEAWRDFYKPDNWRVVRVTISPAKKGKVRK